MTDYLTRVAAAGARTRATARPSAVAPSILPVTGTVPPTESAPTLPLDGFAEGTTSVLDPAPSSLRMPARPVRSRPPDVVSPPSAPGEAALAIPDPARAESAGSGAIRREPFAVPSAAVGAPPVVRRAAEQPRPSSLVSPGPAESSPSLGAIDPRGTRGPSSSPPGAGWNADPGGITSPAAPNRTVAERPLPVPAGEPGVGQRPVVAPTPPVQVPGAPPTARASPSRLRVVVGRVDVQVRVAPVAAPIRAPRSPAATPRDTLASRYLDRFGLG